MVNTVLQEGDETGISGYVLTANGPGVPATFQSSAAGGGGETSAQVSSAISTQAVSDSASISTALSAAESFATSEVTSLSAAVGGFPAAGGLTGVTTINSTTTPTTGGVSLAAQTLASGSCWRVRAFGRFTAGSSSTARSADVKCFWASTALASFLISVLASTAQTTAWELEFIITATSTSAVETTGFFLNMIDSTTVLVQNILAPTATTGLSTGAQIIDLRFFMSVAVTSDSWSVNSVTIERIR